MYKGIEVTFFNFRPLIEVQVKPHHETPPAANSLMNRGSFGLQLFVTDKDNTNVTKLISYNVHDKQDELITEISGFRDCTMASLNGKM